MYTMYKHFLLTGLCSKQWHIKGRRPIINVVELNDCVEVHHQSTGRAVAATDIDPKFNHLKTNRLSKGAHKLTKLVSIANNNAPIYNVLPGLITSTDDTTVFVFKGATK